MTSPTGSIDTPRHQTHQSREATGTAFAAGTSWSVPAALIILSLIPVIAGSLRVIEIAGGPHLAHYAALNRETPPRMGAAENMALHYDAEIRTVLCSTNAIESLNACYRREPTGRGHFPTEQAVLKCL